MLVASFRNLLESAVHATSQLEGISGAVDDFFGLLSNENLTKLEQWHDGVFAYLAFHPEGDKSITEYILEDTLGDDSGNKVLVLFTLACDARWPKPLRAADFGDWIEIDDQIHPSHEVLQLLFKDRTAPPLPGLVFFERFSITEPVFASLTDLDKPSDVREKIRLFCSLAAECSRKIADSDTLVFADCLSRSLAAKSQNYTRGSGISWQEWCIKAFHKLLEKRQDLVSAAKLLK